MPPIHHPAPIATPSVYASLIDAPLSRLSLGIAATFGAMPPAWQFAFAIVFGLVIGSFVNVVVYRLPIMLERAWRLEISDSTGEPAQADSLPARFNLCLPRSACPHCGHVLRAYENIPVLSYVLLRGRCAACRTSIGMRYPLIELASAALAAGALATFGPTGTGLAAFGLTAALLAMSAIDAETRLLPDTLTLPLLWAGLIVNFSDTFASLHAAVAGAIAGYVFLWCVYWLFRFARGVEGMGYGDFKLLAALGAWLGWAALPQVVLIAAVTGAIAGLAAMWSGRLRFDEPLPFGPFLALGGVVTLFTGTSIFHLLGG
ncbi:MAG TPA: A24 family peptidase [Trinickia sp.]|uniref:prepilin peptidase n=1 Tax=Trinickia sp. TaxID=2571163 RepID=UPI002BA5148C|nr:A24 family peptidase [Trinickia sp.]HVW49643.1 A24 family peptidase [Trinickia sp.]